MRAFFDEGPMVVSLQLVVLVLGVGLIVGGIGEGVVHSLFRGLLLIALGAYLTAASLVALVRGAAARSVFVPAGVTAFTAMFGLAFVSGALTS